MFRSPIIRIYELEEHITANAIEYLRIISTALPFIFLSAAFTGIYNAAGRSKNSILHQWDGTDYEYHSRPSVHLRLRTGNKRCRLRYMALAGNGFRHLHLSVAFPAKMPCSAVSLLLPTEEKVHTAYSETRSARSYPKHIVRLRQYVPLPYRIEQGGHIGLMTFTTGGQIEAITWNTSQGFSTALSAFIAQNFAAGRIERVLKAWHTTLWMTGIFGTFCTLLFVFYGNEVFRSFVPGTGSLRSRRCISAYRRIFAAVYDARNHDAGSVLRHRAYRASRHCQHCMQLCAVPLAILFVRMGMGVEGIWWAVCVTTIAKGLILLGWFTMIRKNA